MHRTNIPNLTHMPFICSKHVIIKQTLLSINIMCTFVDTLALETLFTSMDFLFLGLGVTEVGVLADGVDTVGVLSPPSSALPFLGGWYRGGRVLSSSK